MNGYADLFLKVCSCATSVMSVAALILIICSSVRIETTSMMPMKRVGIRYFNMLDMSN